MFYPTPIPKVKVTESATPKITTGWALLIQACLNQEGTSSKISLFQRDSPY